jgi:hypothetical protein
LSKEENAINAKNIDRNENEDHIKGIHDDAIKTKTKKIINYDDEDEIF